MQRARRTAFTLLELLIVIGVIGILMALALAVGARVAGAGKEHKTAGTIKLLDTVLNAYVSTAGGIPPPVVTDPRPNSTNTERLQPVADGRMPDPSGGADGPVINSVGFFLVQARDAAGSEGFLKGIDTRLVSSFDADGPDPSAGNPDWAAQPEMLTVFDGWGRPMRYVHPRFGGMIHGPWANPSMPPTLYVQTSDVLGPAPAGKQYGITQLRRNRLPQAGQPGDSDGGVPRGGTPYFYSAGADGDPATLEDNVYTIKPEFPKN